MKNVTKFILMGIMTVLFIGYSASSAYAGGHCGRTHSRNTQTYGYGCGCEYCNTRSAIYKDAYCYEDCAECSERYNSTYSGACHDSDDSRNVYYYRNYCGGRNHNFCGIRRSTYHCMR